MAPVCRHSGKTPLLNWSQRACASNRHENFPCPKTLVYIVTRAKWNPPCLLSLHCINRSLCFYLKPLLKCALSLAWGTVFMPFVSNSFIKLTHLETEINLILMNVCPALWSHWMQVTLYTFKCSGEWTLLKLNIKFMLASFLGSVTKYSCTNNFRKDRFILGYSVTYNQSCQGSQNGNLKYMVSWHSQSKGKSNERMYASKLSFYTGSQSGNGIATLGRSSPSINVIKIMLPQACPGHHHFGDSRSRQC